MAEQRNIHLADEIWKKLNDISVKESQITGYKVTRSDIIRVALDKFIKGIEKEHEKHKVD